MAKKLWQKNYQVDSMLESFTVRNDYILDQDLVLSDAFASIAHAMGLNKIGIISDEELFKLSKGLKEIIELRRQGNFKITLSDEDCHTAIEGYLTERYGDVGKKIHTGRSRNDQVQTALRLFMREALVKTVDSALDVADSLIAFAENNADVPMPGRTHMQIAMPSSVALWALSFAEEMLDTLSMSSALYDVLDQSPLGSAASYGVPLPLDREYTACLMGFRKIQNNVLYANNSRGRFEAMLLDFFSYIALTISKISQDLMIFTLPELGYFSLPKELTTGSSIMPQKKNPDGLELARSRTALILSLSERVKSIIKCLPSGYNRDFQDTKEPLIEGYKAIMELIGITSHMIEGLVVHPDALEKGCVKELYATDRVMERVLSGGNFRDSYLSVGLNLDDVKEDEDPHLALKKRTSTGTTGNLNVDFSKESASMLRKDNDGRMASLSSYYHNLAEIDELII